MDASGNISRAFVNQSISHLVDDFLPKIRTCLSLIDEADLWWRSGEENNSIGNLLLHLSGNVRQWIVCGLGGEPDRRNRPLEFAARKTTSKGAALGMLEAAVAEAVKVLQNLGPGHLRAEHRIQGFDRNGLQAIYHVVEHFSYHTGQIVYITKHLSRKDLKFYNL